MSKNIAHIIREILSIALVSLAVLSGGDALCQSFDATYQDLVDEVKATRDRADDLQLAQLMVEEAARLQGPVELRIRLCDEAYALGMTSPPGRPTALKALLLKHEIAPGSAEASEQKALQLLASLYGSAGGEEAKSAGELYLKHLGEFSKGAIAAGDNDRAMKLLRKAYHVAGRLRHESKEDIKNQIQWLTRSKRLDEELGQMQAALQANPTSTALIEKVAFHHLMDRDDPKKCLEVLRADATHKDLPFVELAAGNVDLASDHAWKVLGGWYESMIPKAGSQEAKQAMTARAVQYYEQFLKAHEVPDIDRHRVKLALGKLKPASQPAKDDKKQDGRRVAGKTDEDVKKTKPIYRFHAADAADGKLMTHGTRIQGGSVIGSGRDRAVALNGSGQHVHTQFHEHLKTWTVITKFRCNKAPGDALDSGPVQYGSNFQLNWDHRDPKLRGAIAFRIGHNWYRASFGKLEGDKWYTLAATFDGRVLRTYRNGELVEEQVTKEGEAARFYAKLSLGKNHSAQHFFTGLIQYVEVFDKPISGKEIALRK